MEDEVAVRKWFAEAQKAYPILARYVIFPLHVNPNGWPSTPNPGTIVFTPDGPPEDLDKYPNFQGRVVVD